MLSKRIVVSLFRCLNKDAIVTKNCIGCKTLRSRLYSTDQATDVRTVPKVSENEQELELQYWKKAANFATDLKQHQNYLEDIEESLIVPKILTNEQTRTNKLQKVDGVKNLIKPIVNPVDGKESIAACAIEGKKARDHINVVTKPFVQSSIENSTLTLHGQRVKSQRDVTVQLVTDCVEDEHGNDTITAKNKMTTAGDSNATIDSVADGDGNDSVIPVPPKEKFQPMFNFAPLVHKSPTLSKLVALGVDLSTIEHKPNDAASIIMRLDYNTDVQPYLFFLKDLGIQDDQLGRIITKNPYILEDLDLNNLKVRINYLRSKKFPAEDIKVMIQRNPMMLSLNVTKLDEKLGFYQKEFKLTGDELRKAVIKYPNLLTRSYVSFNNCKLCLMYTCGFTRSELKKMFISNAKVFGTALKLLQNNFNFLHNIMGLTHRDILLYPQIFRTRTHILEQRHRYLVSIGRAQYDPKKENYVSLHDLVDGVDEDFCTNVAKTDLKLFNQFIKTL